MIENNIYIKIILAYSNNSNNNNNNIHIQSIFTIYYDDHNRTNKIFHIITLRNRNKCLSYLLELRHTWKRATLLNVL